MLSWNSADDLLRPTLRVAATLKWQVLRARVNVSLTSDWDLTSSDALADSGTCSGYSGGACTCFEELVWSLKSSFHNQRCLWHPAASSCSPPQRSSTTLIQTQTRMRHTVFWRNCSWNASDSQWQRDNGATQRWF